ncbi:uncharacterized protein LOC136039462 [Artemia franciscana]|uniref:uncharacterized protein LOC136039462 n=1 Tax=Artemia franciscana TaxID=6661 RepID=UPI0032D9EBE1
MTIIVAKLGIILLLWDASLAANSSASEDQRNLGVFNRRWECDPLAVYPCGTLDTSAICTLVHEKFVCYCTAPFYILDEDTGLCTSTTEYRDSCSPNQFVCGLDPHGRCLVSTRGKVCICSPGFVNVAYQCVLGKFLLFSLFDRSSMCFSFHLFMALGINQVTYSNLIFCRSRFC